MKITIKKNMSAAAGEKVKEWFANNPGKSFPDKIIIGKGIIGFAAYESEVSPERIIGNVVEPKPFPAELLDSDNVLMNTVIVTLNECDGDVFTGTIVQKTATVHAKAPIEADLSIYKETIKEASKAAGMAVSAVEENVKVMIENDFPKKFILAILNQYKKYALPAHKAKVTYKKASPTDENLKEVAEKVYNRQPVIIQGGQSVGKNICAETAAQIFAMPYFIFTPNADTTAEEIFGGKSTDNSAAEKLSDELAEASLRYQNGEEQFLEDAAKYEKLRALASSVHVITEYSEMATAIEIGGIGMLNEYNMGNPNSLNWVNQVADNTGFIQLPGRGRVTVNKDFVLTATQNPGYEGTMDQNQAAKSRFGVLNFGWPKNIEDILLNTREVKNAIALGADTKSLRNDAKILNDIYMDYLKNVENHLLSDQVLNIRGFARALENATMFEDSLRKKLEIEVCNGCSDKDRTKAVEILKKYLN